MQLTRAAWDNFQGKDIKSLMADFGYKPEPTFDDFMFLYKNVGLARRGIDIWTDMTWRSNPNIKPDEYDNHEPLEEAISKLQKKYDIFGLAKRADTLCCIGRYSVIVINASGKLEEPLQKGAQLIGFAVYSEKQAQVLKWDSNEESPRFGLPESYRITTADQDGKLSKTHTVHHSRIIHIVDDILDSTVYGEPSLKRSYNTLYDIIKIMGSSSHMWYLGAYQGLAFSFDPNFINTDEQIEEYKKAVEEYQNNLKRIIALSGMTVQQLSPSIADPRGNLEMQLELYATERKVPRRILLGSEQGQLASSTDRDMFTSGVAERRERFAGSGILVPLFGRLIQYGMLPQVDDWELEWPPLVEPTEDELINIATRRVGAVRQYVGSSGDVSEIYPVEEFREDIGKPPEVPETDYNISTGDYGEAMDGLPAPEYTDMQGNVVSYLPMKRQRKRRFA